MDAARTLSAVDRAGMAQLLALAAFALGQAVMVNNGVIHPAAIAWLGLAVLASLLSILSAGRSIRSRLAKVSLEKLLAILAAIQWIELLAWGVRWSPRGVGSIGWFIAAVSLVAVGGLLAFFSGRPRVARVALLAGHAAAGVYVVLSSPKPGIDVWLFQQESTTALLHGRNPYEARYRDLYPPELGFYGPGVSKDGWLTYSYPYPPLTLLAAAPGRLLGDVRWAHLAALEAAALLLASLARGRKGFFAAAFLLTSPRSLLVVMAGWTEPMVVLALAATLWCAARHPKKTWIALGILLGVKQYAVLLAPLTPLLMPPNERRRWPHVLGRAIILAAVITLPFFLWNPAAFTRSAVLWQFRQPFRLDALSYVTMLARLTGVQLGAGLGFAAAAGMLAWSLRKFAPSPGAFSAAATLTLLPFFALNKQAFCNYYFLVIATACFTAALIEKKPSAADLQAVRTDDEPFTPRLAA